MKSHAYSSKILRKVHPLIYVLVFALYLGVRLQGLGPDIANSDSIRWHLRSIAFLQAIKTADFQQTYQRYHPGVTLMWSNALVKQGIQTYDLNVSENPGQITYENSEYFPAIHQISKSTQVIILSLIFLFMLYFVSKIFTPKIALIFGFLFSIEPYLIGIDRWFHLTSFEAYFTFISVLTLLFWKIRSSSPPLLQIHPIENRIYRASLYLSACFFILAILSKVTALIISPLLTFLIIYHSNKTEILKNILKFSLTSLATLLVLFPALWYAPIFTLTKIWGGISGGISADARVTTLSTLKANLYYLIVLAYKLSPVTFLLFIPSLWKNRLLLFSKKVLKKENLPIFLIFIYFLTYFLALTVSVKKIDRYSVALIPPIVLLVSYYLSQLTKKNLSIISCAAFLFFFAAKKTYFPVYSAYYSPIFGEKPSQSALKNGFYDNSGEYYAQAAFTLNNIVDDQKVWVPYNSDAFAFFFKRNIVLDFGENVDFAVTSINHLEEVQSYCPEIIYTFGPGKEAIIYILKCPTAEI